MEEGQHQFGGVAVALPRLIVPLLVLAVVRYDLRQRYAERLGHGLCVRGERARQGNFKVHPISPESTGKCDVFSSHVSLTPEYSLSAS